MQQIYSTHNVESRHQTFVPVSMGIRYMCVNGRAVVLLSAWRDETIVLCFFSRNILLSNHRSTTLMDFTLSNSVTHSTARTGEIMKTKIASSTRTHPSLTLCHYGYGHSVSVVMQRVTERSNFRYALNFARITILVHWLVEMQIMSSGGAEALCSFVAITSCSLRRPAPGNIYSMHLGIAKSPISVGDDKSEEKNNCCIRIQSVPTRNCCNDSRTEGMRSVRVLHTNFRDTH